MTSFKKCKLFDKTFEKCDSMVKKKFKDFLQFKSEHPLEQFGHSDYAFHGSGGLLGYHHAKLTQDISIIYKFKEGVIFLYGIFSHAESGTGKNSMKNKQDALAQKLNNQTF